LHLEALFSGAESTPVNWQNYLRNGMAQLSSDLDRSSRDDFPVRGLPASLEGEELINFWKETWAGFAAALDAWREIREAAAEISGSDS